MDGENFHYLVGQIEGLRALMVPVLLDWAKSKSANPAEVLADLRDSIQDDISKFVRENREDVAHCEGRSEMVDEMVLDAITILRREVAPN